MWERDTGLFTSSNGFFFNFIIAAPTTGGTFPPHFNTLIQGTVWGGKQMQYDALSGMDADTYGVQFDATSYAKSAVGAIQGATASQIQSTFTIAFWCKMTALETGGAGGIGRRLIVGQAQGWGLGWESGSTPGMWLFYVRLTNNTRETEKESPHTLWIHDFSLRTSSFVFASCALLFY